jgi:hypothetical protein
MCWTVKRTRHVAPSVPVEASSLRSRRAIPVWPAEVARVAAWPHHCPEGQKQR